VLAPWPFRDGYGRGLDRLIRQPCRVPRSTINGVIVRQAPPPPGRSHRKKRRNRLRSGAWLAGALAIGLALIVVITVPAVLGATSLRHPKPTPTVTITVPLPRPTVTVTVPRPGPTVTVTELHPGPTVTVGCRHPGRGCGGN
jgi:hypothetical protein